MITENEVYLLKVARYFVSKYKYKFVQLKNDSGEIWLGNDTNAEYPVIRITTSSVSSTFYEKNRILRIHDAICETVQKKAKLLDIHISDELIQDKEEDLVQIAISTDTISGDDVSETFPDLKNQIVKIEDPEQEYEKVQTEIKLDQMDKIRKMKKDIRNYPYVSYIIMGICLIVYVIINFLANKTGDQVSSAIFMGAYYKAFIVAGGEYFRFLTAGFTHYDFLHLFVNMLALTSLGQICEKIYGRVNFLVILLVSIITGSAFIFVAQGNVLTVGISGGLYGLLAAMLVYGFNSKLIYNPSVAKSFISTLLLNLMISFLPGISLFGHLGGFVGGLLLSIILTRNTSWAMLRKNTVVAFCVLIAVLGVKITQSQTISPIYGATDLAVLNLADSLGFTEYSKSMETKLEKFYGFQLK